jgi:hypothetical protein
MTTVILLLGALSSVLIGCAIQSREAVAAVTLQQVPTLPGVRGKKEPRDRYSAGRCDHDACFFLVTVKSCTDVTIDPAIMIVKKKRKTTLTWELDAPSGITFDAPEAVPFKPSTAPPPGLFGPERVSADKLTVSRVNYNTAGGTYDYQVRIAKDGVLCGGIDPPIINEF